MLARSHAPPTAIGHRIAASGDDGCDGVHRGAWWRSGSVSARSTRAASGDAGDLISFFFYGALERLEDKSYQAAQMPSRIHVDLPFMVRRGCAPSSLCGLLGAYLKCLRSGGF
jgi:hypothetical protein